MSPFGPHDGASMRPPALESFRSAPVATLIAHTDWPSSRADANAISLSSGDQVGWRASLKRSVMRVAVPPEDGSVQMLPCMSMASVRPSGDTPTDIDVPSWTVTSISADLVGCAARSVNTNANAATDTSTPTAIRLLRIAALLDDGDCGVLLHAFDRIWRIEFLNARDSSRRD